MLLGCFFSFPMQTQDFTQQWLTNEYRFHDFPKQHISDMFLKMVWIDKFVSQINTV